MVDDVDLVITYVDNTDPKWQEQISYYNTTIDDKRYRNWDNLSYLLKLVEKNMKFIRTVHLVVSDISQVPKWIDRNKIHIVYHKDIIPEKYLPTFNSTTIEMFLYRIEGLSNKFIYSNDDMFPLKELQETDFFIDGKPIYQLIYRTDRHNSFRMQCYNSWRLAHQALSKETVGDEYFYVRHSMDPMLRSTCKEVWDRVGDKILWSITRFREPFNYTQYLFPDYDILRGNFLEKEYDFCYYKLNDVEYVRDSLINNKNKIVCLNDSSACKDFQTIKDAIIEIFKGMV